MPKKPIHVLADSELLFWRNGEGLLLATLASSTAAPPKAAYLGASNGDRPEFYSVFEAAMDLIGVRNCRMIPSQPDEGDLAFLMSADVILLAGGDVQHGWQVFDRSGLRELIVRRYDEGAWLVGVSAGAVQLGLMGWTMTTSPDVTETFDTFQLIPYVIAAHDEGSDWAGLNQAVRSVKRAVRGVGLPTGGGAIYHAGDRLEPIRYPLYEIAVTA